MKIENFAATTAPRPALAFIPLLACFLLAAPAFSQAPVDQTWLNAGPSNDWSITALNWNGPAAWTNGNNAIFGGSGETVEIASDVIVNNITFNSTGYIITDADAGSLFSLSTGSIITVTTAGHMATISESIAAGDLIKAGAGSLHLSGANTFDGAVSVTAGTLRLASNTALGSTVGTTSVTGATPTGGIIELQNGVTITGETINVGSGGDNNGGLRSGVGATATWAGSILLDGGNRIGALNNSLFDITGVISNGTTGTLQIATTGASTATLGTVRISALATYTGGTSIIRGRLQLGIDGALPTTTIVDIDTATASEDSIFDLNGHIQTIAGLARAGGGPTGGPGGSFVTNSSATAATLTIGGTTTQTYSGIVQDGAGLLNIVKSGTGTQTLSGDNTYTGTTSVSAGTLVMSGNNTLPGAITVTGGTLTMAGANTLGPISLTTGGTMTLSGSNILNGSITVNAATLTLSGSNTLAPTANVLVTGTNSVLTLGNSGSLGAPGGGTVTASLGGRIVLQAGVTITGKTLSIAQGGNNNGALQTATGATATWNGNIITTSGDARIGGGDGGNLIINGVISGVGGVLYSRANNSTTTLNGLNTYTGDTQLFANGGTGARIVIGVDNALTTSRLSVLSSTSITVATTLDLNGHPITLTAADTSAKHDSGNFLFVQNNGTAPATLTFSGVGISPEQVFNGKINDGTSGASGMSLIKNGTYIQTLVNANGYTGTTTLNAGTLQLGKGAGTLFTGSNGSLASTTIILNGIGGSTASTTANTATLAIDNLGTSNNSGNRLADTATLSLRGGTFLYRGSELTGINSSEALGTLESFSKRSILTVSYGGSNTAAVTFSNYSRVTNGGTILVNGANLGLNGTAAASISRVFFTTAPELVGLVDALSTGINAASKETKIVPGLLGESASGVGTTTGIPNTFLTYEASTGLRPLDPATEFTLNAINTDDNTLYNNGVVNVLPASATINSLIINGAGTGITIGAGKTLTITSGNILFATGSAQVLGNNGDLSFAGREGIITINTGTTFVTARITGSAGVSYYGTGAVATNQQSTYSGNTALYLATAIPQVSSQGVAGAPTSGPFGTGTIIFAGAGMRASTAGAVTLHNNIELRNDTTLASGSTVNSTLTFVGGVSLTNGTRTITNSSDSNTYYTGVISETTPGSGITIAGNSLRPITFSGANTYTGATTLTTNNATLLVNGNQSAATGAVNVNAGTLGGTGTLGGLTTIASGATLSPGDPATANGIGTLNSISSLTLRGGSNTALQITTATFTSLDGFGGNFPGTQGYTDYVIANGNTAGGAGAAHDKLIFTGITQETTGKITVTGVAFTPIAGQIFNLIDWADLSTFSSNLGPTTRNGLDDNGLYDLDLPDISTSGYLWDTSLFTTHGIIVITPEPARALLLGVGLTLLALRRRK